MGLIKRITSKGKAFVMNVIFCACVSEAGLSVGEANIYNMPCICFAAFWRYEYTYALTADIVRAMMGS